MFLRYRPKTKDIVPLSGKTIGILPGQDISQRLVKGEKESRKRGYYPRMDPWLSLKFFVLEVCSLIVS